MVDARIKLVDGSGAAVKLTDVNGNAIPYAVTNVADGSFTLYLTTGTPTLPLFIEAAGTDGTGTPVVLHSLLQSTTAPVVANITPLTDAVVAELLGANPLTIFQSAASNAKLLANLGNSSMVSAAAAQIIGIVGANLNNAKISSPSTLNLFQDATFTTNKLGVDATLEGLRIQIVKDVTGADQLQLSNRFVPIQSPEVTVNLATAETQLGKGSSGNLASAITSSTAKTTVATSTLSNISSLDTLTVAINNLIGQRAGASISQTTFAPLMSASPTQPSPPLTTGTGPYFYNGRNATQLEQLLSNYSANNYQLSSMQITGCIDDPIPSKGCINFAVSSVVTDTTGKLVDVFSDGVTFNKSTTPNWTISGNGRYTTLGVYPVAYAVFGLNGSLTNLPTVNPAVGVQVNIQSQDSNGAQIAGNSEVQIPSGQSVPFAYCSMSVLCIWPTPSILPTATGDLSDTLLQQPTLGWLGSVDAQQGAKYIITYQGWLGFTVQGPNTNSTANAYLPAAPPASPAQSVFPAIDGVTSGAPLTGTSIASGFTISWLNWANANPNMRVISVRTVIVSTGSPSVITDTPIPLGNVTSIRVNPATLPAGFTPTSYEVWIGAVDNLGRRFYTQMVGSS